MALLGWLEPGVGPRGSAYSAVVLLYAGTSWLAGYVSGRAYAGFGGRRWALNGLLAAGLFPGPLLLVFLGLNGLAVSYGSTTALPAVHVATLVGLYLGLALPLAALGVSRGRRGARAFVPPVRTSPMERPVPPAVGFFASGPRGVGVWGVVRPGVVGCVCLPCLVCRVCVGSRALLIVWC